MRAHTTSYIFLCVTAMGLFCTTPLGAQSWGSHLTAVAVISAQPDEGPFSSPYLDHGIGGTRPGLNVGFGVEAPESPVIMGFELSTTAAMETIQNGRFIPGMRPALSRHRDTLLSILPGVRWRAGGATMEAKGGLSFRFGEPTQAGEPVEDFSAGHFALTAGFDAVFPLAGRVSLVPSFRYSAAERGDDVEINWVGLSKHITRFGVGLRVRLNGD